MISKGDVVVINRTREVLKGIASKSVDTKPRDYPTGKVHEAATAAERALMNVLLVAHVHTDSDVSETDISMRKEGT